MTAPLRLHASCVAIEGRGVLLSGLSGAGKSDIALQLIALGAVLVSDDQTEVLLRGEALLARAPASIAGLIEARQVGLLELPYAVDVPISLHIELVGPDVPLERLPEPSFYSLLDRPVRSLKLRGREASTPAKIWLTITGILHDAHG